MKAEHLRVGNILLDFEGNSTPIGAVDILAVSQCNIANTPVEFLKEIPLTEEWLIKFGFIKLESFDFGISLDKVPRYELNDFSVMLSGEKMWYTTRQYDGGTSDPYEPVIEVPYVHKLQNLFYEITGEELTPNKTDNK